MKHVVAADRDVAHGAAETARVVDVGQRSTYQIHRPEITVTSRTLCLYFSEKYNTSHFNERKKNHFQFSLVFRFIHIANKRKRKFSDMVPLT